MFLLIPTSVDYRTRRLPVVTFSLMAINILIYIVTLVLWSKDIGLSEEDFEERSLELWFMMKFWLIPAESTWYTYFTSMFVHADIWHLLGNMIYLFLFGCCVEDTIGRGRYIALYLLGGLASIFMHIAFTAEHFASEIPLGGASGAIFACMGAFLILLPKRQVEFKYLIFFFFRLFSGEFFMAAWIVMSFYFLSDLLSAILSHGEGGGGTAFGAHVGGFIAGMGLGFIGKLLLKRDEAEELSLAAYQAASERPTFYIFDNGSQIGPFSRRQIRDMMELGSISEHAVFWEEGMPDWQPVSLM